MIYKIYFINNIIQKICIYKDIEKNKNIIPPLTGIQKFLKNFDLMKN